MRQTIELQEFGADTRIAQAPGIGDGLVAQRVDRENDRQRTRQARKIVCLERRQARIGGVGALRIIGDTDIQAGPTERRIGVASAGRIIILAGVKVDGRVKKELCVKRPPLLRPVAHGDADRRR